MGWGLPASVGLKIVYPDRPVVCVTGDGGYMMTGNALSVMPIRHRASAAAICTSPYLSLNSFSNAGAADFALVA